MNKEEKKQIKDFEYWVNTNNEKGVCSIPDYICNRVLNLIDKQNKVIDLMSEQLAGLTIWNNNKEEPLILGNKEEVKKYYFRKVEEDDKD